MIERVCKYCESKFTELSGRQFSNHVRWCDKNLTNGDKGGKAISEAVNKRHDIKLGEYKEFTLICANIDCGKAFMYRCREINIRKAPKFCSSECKHKIVAQVPRIWSTDMRKLASDKTKLLWDDEEFVNKFINNNNNTMFSSKGEKEVKKWFVEKFPSDCWTSGGNLKYKDGRLVRDLYSKKLKVCIEYDGIWHFKDIHNQLERKQYKDKLLEEWCIENGWRLIRIDEIVYNKNKLEALNTLLECVYNKAEPIIKIGGRY